MKVKNGRKERKEEMRWMVIKEKLERERRKEIHRGGE